MAAFKGRLAVNVDTMCAFGDRVSETAAAEIEFGLLGFVREGVERHPSTDRHALIAERDAEVRAGIDARAAGPLRRRGGLLACRDRPGRAGGRRRCPRPVARGVGPVPRGRHRDDPRHHVRRGGVRGAAHRLRDRGPAGAPGPPERWLRRHARRRDVGRVVVARPRRLVDGRVPPRVRLPGEPRRRPLRDGVARGSRPAPPDPGHDGVDAGGRRPGGDRRGARRRPRRRRGRAARARSRAPTATPPNGPSPTPGTSPSCASR